MLLVEIILEIFNVDVAEDIEDLSSGVSLFPCSCCQTIIRVG